MIFFPSQWRVVSAVYLMVICNLCKNMTVKEMVWPTFFQLWRIWMMIEDHPYRSPRCSPTLDCSGVKRFASVAASAQCSELAWDIPPGSHPCRMRDQWTFFPVTLVLTICIEKKNTVIDRISISLVQKPFWSQSKDSDTTIFLLPFKKLIKTAKNWKMLLIKN